MSKNDESFLETCLKDCGKMTPIMLDTCKDTCQCLHDCEGTESCIKKCESGSGSIQSNAIMTVIFLMINLSLLM